MQILQCAQQLVDLFEALSVYPCAHATLLLSDIQRVQLRCSRNKGPQVRCRCESAGKRRASYFLLACIGALENEPSMVQENYLMGPILHAHAAGAAAAESAAAVAAAAVRDNNRPAP